MKTIRGKTALVTGAASGIGRAISLALAKQGAEVYLLDIDPEGLESVAAECRGAGELASGDQATVHCIPCDLSDPDQITAAVERLLAERDGVDILVNNAGIVYYGPTGSITAEQRERLLAVNLHAPIQLTCELLPAMSKRYEAHVVNVASMYGLIAVPRTSVYHATKFGLVGFSESLRRECSRRGLGVSTICPGMIRTKLFQSGASGFENRDVPEPPRWAAGSPERVAQKTIRAIRRDRRMVLVTPLAYLGAYLQRFTPWIPDMLYRFGRRRKMRTRRRQLQQQAVNPQAKAKAGAAAEAPRAKSAA